MAAFKGCNITYCTALLLEKNIFTFSIMGHKQTTPGIGIGFDMDSLLFIYLWYMQKRSYL